MGAKTAQCAPNRAQSCRMVQNLAQSFLANSRPGRYLRSCPAQTSVFLASVWVFAPRKLASGLPLFGCQTSQLPARTSRAIHLYTRPTSFSRANGTVGVGARAATSGRAGDNVFWIFQPIPANPAQNCARKRVAWRRQHPPRPGVAVRHDRRPKLWGGFRPPRKGRIALSRGRSPRNRSVRGISPKGAEETAMRGPLPTETNGLLRPAGARRS